MIIQSHLQPMPNQTQLAYHQNSVYNVHIGNVAHSVRSVHDVYNVHLVYSGAQYTSCTMFTKYTSYKLKALHNNVTIDSLYCRHCIPSMECLPYLHFCALFTMHKLCIKHTNYTTYTPYAMYTMSTMHTTYIMYMMITSCSSCPYHIYKHLCLYIYLHTHIYR